MSPLWVLAFIVALCFKATRGLAIVAAVAWLALMTFVVLA